MLIVKIKGWALTFSIMLVFVLAGNAWAAESDVPVTVDSRIRTLIYSSNEVFKMYTQYGYQSSIEFAVDEQIATISLGSPSAFKITPAGSRVFIKALQKGRHTNMTVLTTKRAYQFELYSDVDAEDKVIYVMRFFYPEELDEEEEEEEVPVDLKADVKPKDGDVKAKEEAGKDKAPANYNYSLTGPEAISPVKIYDEGGKTYFQFNGAVAPSLYGVNIDGSEYPLVARQENGMWVVDGILPRISVRQGEQVVCVYNEAMPTVSPVSPVQ